jgi:hypothetical protein
MLPQQTGVDSFAPQILMAIFLREGLSRYLFSGEVDPENIATTIHDTTPFLPGTFFCSG